MHVLSLFGIILRYIISKESKLLEIGISFGNHEHATTKNPQRTFMFSMTWFNSITTLSKMLLSSWPQSSNYYEKQRLLISTPKCQM
jgi:hypothetical protein